MPKVSRDKFLANDAVTIEQCERFIARFLRRYISDVELVADATQSALVRLIAKLNEEGELSSEDMLRELSNTASNALRRRLTQLRRKVVAYESQLHTPSPQDEEFSRYIDQCNELAQIEAVLEHFKGQHVEIFIAKIRGFTNQEIAEDHGKTPAAVQAIADRTRQKLRLELTAEEKRKMLISLAQQLEQEALSPFQPDPDASSE